MFIIKVISATLAGIAYRETTCKRLNALQEEIENEKKDRKDVEAIFSILTKPFAGPEKNTNWKRDNKSFEAWYGIQIQYYFNYYFLIIYYFVKYYLI